MPGTPYLNLKHRDLAGFGTAFYTLISARSNVSQYPQSQSATFDMAVFSLVPSGEEAH